MKTERIVKVTIIWFLVAVSVAILSKQIVSMFYNTWLGSVIKGINPNILWVCFVLTIIWLYYTWKKKYKGFNIVCFGLSLFTFIIFCSGNVELADKAYNLLFFAILFLLSLPQLMCIVGFIWKKVTKCFRKLKLRIKVIRRKVTSIQMRGFIGIIWKNVANYLRSKKKETNKPEEEQDVILFQGPSNKVDSIFIYDRFDKDYDKLHVGREQMVDTIVDQVRKLKHDDSSFTIGLEGGWGSGKTTLLNKIKSELKDSTDAHGMTVEVVEFSPWAYPDGKSLSVEFLYELRNVLCRHSFRARFVINAYINALAERSTNLVQLFTSLFFPRESLQKVKAKLSDLLRFHRVKLVVIIDDLDRLDADEMAEVFKMLRNTGDLPNAVYLVAYDRMHVETIDSLKQKERLEEKQEECCGRFGSGYLDKVINVELDINGYNKDVLFGEFLSKATMLMKSGDYFLIDVDNFNGFESLDYAYHSHLRIIKTKRDQARILNSLSFRINQLNRSFSETTLPIRFNPELLLVIELLKHSKNDQYKELRSKCFWEGNNVLSQEVSNDPLYKACIDLMKNHKAIEMEGKGLKIEPVNFIDYYFVQNQMEAVIIYEMDRTVYFSSDRQESNLPSILQRYLDSDGKDKQLNLIIRDRIITFLKKNDWDERQLKDLVALILVVIKVDSLYSSILSSLKSFVIEYLRPFKRALILRILFTELHNSRDKAKNYNICFCELSQEAIKDTTNGIDNDLVIQELTKLQYERNDLLLEENRFKEALKESVYFNNERSTEGSGIIDGLRKYLQFSNRIVKSFEKQLITEDKNGYYIGGRDFPIGILFPNKGDLISTLKDAEPDEELLINLASFLEKHINIIQKLNNVFWIRSEKDICYKELEVSKLLRFLYRSGV